MRIGIASSGLGHVARGVEAWAADLARALAGRGQAVTLFKGGGRAEAPYERVVPCWRRGEARTARLLKWLPRRGVWRLGLGSAYEVEQTTFALRLLGRLRAGRVDVLHVQDPYVALLVQRAWQLGLVRTRVVLAHGTEEPLEFQRKIVYLQHLAPWHLEEARAAGVWRPTWTAIPNFIDTDHFSPGGSEALRAELGVPPDGQVVLTVAAIKRPHKRVDYFLNEGARIFQCHPELQVWFVVAGGWEQDTEELVEFGRRLLGDRVRFLVRFPRARMAELYRLADLFVLCSLKEMMPIALLEAAASGLPCLVNRHPVVEWMVGPGGEAIDMAAAGGLAETVGKLLREPGRRRQLGALARRHCVQCFGQEQVVDRILAYYDLVTARRES